jgi:hypothetical protein
MKKLTALFVGASFMAGAIASAADTATSVNIVGFQKITCPKGQLVMVSTAFKSLDGTPLKSVNVFSNQVPNGTSVYAYDSVTAQYKIDNKTIAGWGTNITYDGKMGFFVKVSPSAASNSYDVVMAGEVPMDSVITNSVYPALNMMGYPYTASIAWTNTSLAKNARNGDTLYVWTGTNYDSYNKTISGWGPATNLVINTGMGFWFKSSRTSLTNFFDVRPYNP